MHGELVGQQDERGEGELDENEDRREDITNNGYGREDKSERDELCSGDGQTAHDDDGVGEQERC